MSKKRSGKARGKQRARGGLTRIAACVAASVLVACAWAASKATRSGSGQKVVAISRTAAQRTERSANPAGPAKRPAAPAWAYEAVVTRNLFKPLTADQPETQAVPPAIPLEVFDLPDFGAAESEPADTEAAWVYAGFATIDGRPVAIIENAENKRAQFLGVGEELDGRVVSEISPDTVRLTRNGESTSMKISDAFTATPLNEPPRPAREPSRDERGRRRGGSAQDDAARSEFFQRFGDRGRRFMEMRERFDRFSNSEQSPRPEEARQPEGEQQ